MDTSTNERVQHVYFWKKWNFQFIYANLPYPVGQDMGTMRSVKVLCNIDCYCLMTEILLDLRRLIIRVIHAHAAAL